MLGGRRGGVHVISELAAQLCPLKTEEVVNPIVGVRAYSDEPRDRLAGMPRNRKAGT